MFEFSRFGQAIMSTAGIQCRSGQIPGPTAERLALRCRVAQPIAEGKAAGPKRRTFIFVNNRLERNTISTIAAILKARPARATFFQRRFLCSQGENCTLIIGGDRHPARRLRERIGGNSARSSASALPAETQAGRHHQHCRHQTCAAQTPVARQLAGTGSIIDAQRAPNKWSGGSLGNRREVRKRSREEFRG